MQCGFRFTSSAVQDNDNCRSAMSAVHDNDNCRCAMSAVHDNDNCRCAMSAVHDNEIYSQEIYEILQGKLNSKSRIFGLYIINIYQEVRNRS